MRALLLIWQAVVSRVAGGGIWPQRPAGLAEFAFAAPFLLAWTAWPWWVGTLVVMWPYAWFQTGHGTAHGMGENPDAAQGSRKELLSRVVDPVCDHFDQPLGGPFYCWLFMGLKGFLIHMPLGLWALPAAVLWPAAYHIGNVVYPRLTSRTDGEVVSELLAGAFSGLLIALSF